MTVKKSTRKESNEAAGRYKNWRKWGLDDEIGTLNCTSPEDIIAATQLPPRGKYGTKPEADEKLSELLNALSP